MEEEILKLTKAYIRSGVDDLISTVETDKDQLNIDISLLEEKMNNLASDFEKKYPNVILEIISRRRKSSSIYDEEKGGNVQLNYYISSSNISSNLILWD